MNNFKKLLENALNENVDLKKIKKEYDKNEDNNFHTENFLLLAQTFGTKEQVKKVKEIMKKNKKQGYTDPKDNKWMYDNLNHYYKKLVK